MFLYKVKQHNKKLFQVMALFVAATLLCNLTGNEVTPFFVWGMYSAKEPPVHQYELLQTTLNDSIVLNVDGIFTGDTRFYLSTPLGYYKAIKDNQRLDPTISFLQKKLRDRYNGIRFAENRLFNTNSRQQQFMSWYARYVGQATGIPVHSLRVDVVKLHFDGAQLVKDSVYLFEKWSTP